jgi:hypothetical protein
MTWLKGTLSSGSFTGLKLRLMVGLVSIIPQVVTPPATAAFVSEMKSSSKER